MKRYSKWFTPFGFLLAGVGFLALALNLVGVELVYLLWLDFAGELVGFILKLLMIMAGIILIYLSQSNFEGERI